MKNNTGSEFFDAIKTSISNTYRYAKPTFYFTIINNIINASKVYIFAYINQLLLNNLSNALQHFYGLASFVSIAKLVFYNWLLIMVFNLASKLFNYFSMSSLLKYDLIMNKEFSNKLSSISIAYYDDPKQYDFINQAFNDRGALLGLYETLINFITTVFSFVSAFVIILKFDPVVSMIIIFSTFPALFIKKKIKIDSYNLEQNSARIRRKSNYFFNIFKDKNASQDIRMYPSLKSLFLSKYEVFTQEKNVLKQKQYKRNSLLEFIFTLFQGLVDALLNIHILYTIIKEKLSIGEFSFYTTITQNFKKTLEGCFSHISDMLVFSRRVCNYKKFMHQSNGNTCLTTLKVNRNLVHKIQFVNVSFKYPNTNNYVLKNVDFEFLTNEKIAFAGINGAGKTTIIKLLLRLYEPTSGEILLDDININRYTVESYRDLFSTMFQNYLNYNIKVFENVTLHEGHTNYDKVICSLEMAELHQFKENPKLVEFEYSKYFDTDGIVLSLGQAQKLNMARAIYKDSQIYVFDEPSASLDAKSEQIIFDKVFEITQDKGLILISHKLNNLKRMDKIIFLSNCTVESVGNHNKLMEEGGTYSKLYNIQLNSFIN